MSSVNCRIDGSISTGLKLRDSTDVGLPAAKNTLNSLASSEVWRVKRPEHYNGRDGQVRTENPGDPEPISRRAGLASVLHPTQVGHE